MKLTPVETGQNYMTRPPTNNINTNQPKRLSVQLTLTGLSFLISSEDGSVQHFLEREFDTPHTPEELLFELDHIFSNEAPLKDSFDTVHLVYTTHNYTLVPKSLFDETKASEYLKFNTKILANDYISHDEIENQNAVVVYVPLVNINNYIFDKFGSFSYFHSSTLLIQYLLKAEKHSEDTKVYLHVLKGQFDAIIIANGTLQLCNSYRYSSPEDFVYYVLFCFEQLRLNPEQVEVILCGMISPDSDLFEILYDYVRNVRFLEPGLPKFTSELPHQHFLLKATL